MYFTYELARTAVAKLLFNSTGKCRKWGIARSLVDGLRDHITSEGHPADVVVDRSLGTWCLLVKKRSGYGMLVFCV